MLPKSKMPSAQPFFDDQVSADSKGSSGAQNAAGSDSSKGMPKKRGLDGKFNQILDEVAKRSINDQMAALAHRESSH